MSLFCSGERTTPLRYAAQRMESYYGWKNTKLAHILYLFISYHTWKYTHHLFSSLVYEWSLWISSEVYNLMNWHVRDDGIVTSVFVILYRLYLRLDERFCYCLVKAKQSCCEGLVAENGPWLTTIKKRETYSYNLKELILLPWCDFRKGPWVP